MADKISENIPLVSIIIVNWNRKDDLCDTLKNLQKQTYKNCEVIIIDNDSSDGSQEMVRTQYPEYNLIIMSRNLGCEEGFNMGIVNSIGPIIIFMDNDALFEIEGIQKIVNEFQKDPLLGIVDPRIYNFYSKQITNEPLRWPTKNMFTGCAAGIRREVIDKIGLRPEEYFIYGSEPDICIRALDAGYRIKHCCDIIAYHKESPVKRLSAKFYYYSTRNVLWLIWKHYPVLPAISESLMHLAVNLIKSIKSLALHYFIGGVIEGVFRLPVVILKRRKPLVNWKEGRVYPSLSQLIVMYRKKRVL